MHFVEAFHHLLDPFSRLAGVMELVVHLMFYDTHRLFQLMGLASRAWWFDEFCGLNSVAYENGCDG